MQFEWLSPAAAPAPAPKPRRPVLGLILAASLVSAFVASAVTVGVVNLGRTETPAGPTANAAVAQSTPSASPAANSSAAAGSSPSTSPGPVAGLDPSSVIVDVAARVSPAVVTITSDISGNSVNPFSIPETGVGSGFVFNSDGWILTNAHVVEGATSLTVTFKDRHELSARVVTQNADADLAVIKVDATGLPTVDIGSSANLLVGQLVVAIGSPLGTYSESVTSGILSATDRSITVSDPQTRRRRQMTDLLQTDAAINPGNSGGPLLDAGGRVIGINSAVAASAEGIGFAIPIDAARSIMSKATGST